MADDAERLAGGERVGEQSAGDRVDGEVLHRAVTAGVEDGVVVGEIDLVEGDRTPQRGRAGEDLGDRGRTLGAAVDLGGHAGLVDGRDHAVRGCHGDGVARAGEGRVGRGEFLGPVAGGMFGAVGQCPMIGAGENEQDVCHGINARVDGIP